MSKINIDNELCNYIDANDGQVTLGGLAEHFAEYGYQYAQDHPAWVSVKKELPEPNTYKEGKTSQSVLVCLADWYIDTDAYDTDNKVWCKYDGEVEYWMVLPTPPVKKGGSDE